MILPLFNTNNFVDFSVEFRKGFEKPFKGKTLWESLAELFRKSDRVRLVLRFTVLDRISREFSSQMYLGLTLDGFNSWEIEVSDSNISGTDIIRRERLWGIIKDILSNPRLSSQRESYMRLLLDILEIKGMTTPIYICRVSGKRVLAYRHGLYSESCE